MRKRCGAAFHGGGDRIGTARQDREGLGISVRRGCIHAIVDDILPGNESILGGDDQKMLAFGRFVSKMQRQGNRRFPGARDGEIGAIGKREERAGDPAFETTSALFS